MNLDNVGLNVTGITGQVVLIRVGKNKNLALDKRPADQDLYRVLELLQKHNGDFKQDFCNPTTKEWFSYTVKKLNKPPIKAKE